MESFGHSRCSTSRHDKRLDDLATTWVVEANIVDACNPLDTVFGIVRIIYSG
jgi:hypothetical protein